MKSYKIIRADSLLELENKVNEAMQEGYIPVGGVDFTKRHNFYIQSMYKI